MKLSTGERQMLRALLAILTALAAFALIAQVSAVIGLFSGPLLIFILAWMVAFLLAPVVNGLDSRTPLNRVGAVGVVYLFMTLVIVAIIVFGAPALASQLTTLAKDATSYASGTAEFIAEIQARVDSLGLKFDIAALYNSLPGLLGSISQSAASGALGLAGAMVTFIFNLTLVMIISFLILVDGSRLWASLTGPLSKEFTSEAELLRQAAQRSFGGYMRGTILLAAIYALGTLIILTLLGVQFSGLLAAISGLAMLVPFFGPPIALLPVAFAAMLGSRVHPLIVIASILMLQQVVLNVLGPRVLSKSLGIHPLFVFGALLLGAQVAGFWGALFGVPIAGIFATLVRYVVELIQGHRKRHEADEMIADHVEAAEAEVAEAAQAVEEAKAIEAEAAVEKAQAQLDETAKNLDEEAPAVEHSKNITKK